MIVYTKGTLPVEEEVQMTNYEHYKAQLEKLDCLGLKFAIKKEKPMTITVCGGLKCEDCLFGDGCSAAKLKWANEKYIESSVDWSQVPVDTKIFVSNSVYDEWKPGHFAKYVDDYVYAWDGGCTSFTTKESSKCEYVKLAEE